MIDPLTAWFLMVLVAWNKEKPYAEIGVWLTLTAILIDKMMTMK